MILQELLEQIIQVGLESVAVCLVAVHDCSSACHLSFSSASAMAVGAWKILAKLIINQLFCGQKCSGAAVINSATVHDCTNTHATYHRACINHGTCIAIHPLIQEW
jgi:hypothetical protein